MTDNEIRLPLISVVVPVYNGEAVIRECIESLLAMEYPQEKLEILIVDNNSTDRTRGIIQEYHVTLLCETIQGCGAAKNRGIQNARGDIIGFTDSDCVVARTWAQEIAKAFQDPRVEAVRGFSHGINKNICATFAQKRWEEFWFHKEADGYSLKRKGIEPRSCAVRKHAFEKYGYFNPAMIWCEDLELSVRFNRAQCHIAFNPAMKVWHKNPTSFGVIEEKNRERMAFILRLLRDLPEGIRWEDVPLPRSAFYGLATKDMGKVTLSCALPLLQAVRRVLFAIVHLAVGLRMQNAMVYKLYKISFGLSYDLAILQAKQMQQKD